MKGFKYVSGGHDFTFQRTSEVEGEYQLDLIDHKIWLKDGLSSARVWPVIEDATARLDLLMEEYLAHVKLAGRTRAIPPASDEGLADPPL
jgi:hypothetical protein